ncbi:hypothetical protein AQUCO_01600121v1 [Aquilegia coerulea]|uniref:Uncharacterized protein n=1 Tax=Aquilegia coerulea TaxID=218851 RepID=A0A2G5DQ68_AQUCA|nr:hypothetical protein AQUCO_01600121v1 [Aquilegia coerulea]
MSLLNYFYHTGHPTDCICRFVDLYLYKDLLNTLVHNYICHLDKNKKKRKDCILFLRTCSVFISSSHLRLILKTELTSSPLLSLFMLTPGNAQCLTKPKLAIMTTLGGSVVLTISFKTKRFLQKTT